MDRTIHSKFLNSKLWSEIIFPLILVLLPLSRCNIGVDVTDTGYSLGSFMFQGEQMGEAWVKFATYLATVTGSFFARLPYGDTMLGMNLYTGLFVSGTALIMYYFLSQLLTPWIVFAGEILAVSLCWCPTVILYNYLTYFLFSMMIFCLYQALKLVYTGNRTEERRGIVWFLLAGVILGLNVMTRIPNITHGAMILVVWYAAWLHGHDDQAVGEQKKVYPVVLQTVWCILGFLVGFGIVFLSIIIEYGGSVYLDMLHYLFGGNGSGVEGHSMGDMIWPIIDAYLVGMKWFLFMALVITGGVLMFSVLRDRFLWIKKIVYLVMIMVLIRFYYGRGMFNFRYYAYESMFQWMVLFLIVSVLCALLQLCGKKSGIQNRLLASMVLIVIFVTPLGSDNYLYPNINNLFFVAPVVLYWLIRYISSGSSKIELPFLRKGLQIHSYPIKAMLVTLLCAILIQGILFGRTFVFRDGMRGEVRDTKITENRVLNGMVTNRDNAEALEGITTYVDQENLTDRKVVLYGNVPALSCFLQMPTALSTSWADLDSYTVQTMKKDLDHMQRQIDSGEMQKPILIFSTGFDAWLTEDLEGMIRYQVDPAVYDKDEKAALLKQLIADTGYEETYLNSQFVIYQ